MSVLKNNRNLSKMEFYQTARQLREDITTLLLRDFGVRDKVRRVKTEENLEITVIEQYPDWLIVAFRSNIMQILRNMMMNITAGNTIYPITHDELAVRRRYQNGAIVNCEQLLQEFHYCADILPIKLNKFLPYVDKIVKEIDLLKGWRKSNNTFAKIIDEKLTKGRIPNSGI